MKRSAFTMVELIFVIVIIGILASVAIPKFSGIKDGAKKTAEIATISAVSTALATANGEWSINEGEFKWGNGMTYSNSNKTLNDSGYPTDLNKTNYTTNKQPFDAVLKGDNSQFTMVQNPTDCNPTTNGTCKFSVFTGPASDKTSGVKIPSIDAKGKPDKNDFWIYTSEVNCDSNKSVTYLGKTFLSGDILLIDTNDTASPTYSPTLTCN